MLPQARREIILELLDQKNILSFAELSKSLGVSQMTIRRDVLSLCKDGLVTQVAKGVQLARVTPISENNHIVKQKLYANEKRRIAIAASQLIHRNSCVFLDAGSTSLAICPYLVHRNDLVIVTNDITIVNFFTKNKGPSVIMTGGYILERDMCASGHLAAQTINSLAIDIAFLSTSSFDERGITTPDEKKIALKQAASRCAKRCILIADSSKYGHYSTYLAVPLSGINTIITDNRLSEQARHNFKNLPTELMIV